MRPIPMLTFAAALALASAAAAQVKPVAPTSLAASADEINLPPIADDQAEADSMKVLLAQYDARIRADELRMTTLRDATLAKSNARLKAIKPALPLHGTTWIQLFP